MTDSIEAIDAYSVPWYYTPADIDLAFDFNNDNVVDIADYHIASFSLSDDDSTNDVNFTQEELDTVFAEIIKFDAMNNDYTKSINQENANKLAEKYLAELAIQLLSPTDATTLLELRQTGMKLSGYMKDFASIQAVLTAQIDDLKKEIKNIENEKAPIEEELSLQNAILQNKTQLLQAKTINVLFQIKQSQKNSVEKANNIVAETVEKYKNGEFPNQSLQDVIILELAEAKDGGFDTASLQYEIKNCTNLGNEITKICDDINCVINDLKSISERYNYKTGLLNRTIRNFDNINGAFQNASNVYQTGYAKKTELREELIAIYKTDAGGEKFSSNNPQVQMLNTFLTNKELSNMTYSDAYEVLKAAFDGCGLKFNDKNYRISVPYGHDSTSKKIFNTLVAQIKDNFRVNAIYGDEYGDDIDPSSISRNDPVSFVIGNVKFDFISDNNNNGKFDDATEFLGAKNGWQEMIAYDTNNDGIINGNELDKVKLLGINQTTGDYNFFKASDIKLESINLDSYQEKNQMLENSNILAGEFQLSVGGNVVNGVQTYDTEKNLDNSFQHIFNAQIRDTEAYYKENPFGTSDYENFDKDKIARDNKVMILTTFNNAKQEILSTQTKIDNNVANSIVQGERDKKQNDEKVLIDKKEEEKQKEKDKKTV